MKKSLLPFTIFVVVVLSLTWLLWFDESESSLVEDKIPVQSSEIREVQRQTGPTKSTKLTKLTKPTRSAPSPVTVSASRFVQFRVIDSASDTIQSKCSLRWIGSQLDLAVPLDPEVKVSVERELFNKLEKCADNDEDPNKIIEIVDSESTFFIESVKLTALSGPQAPLVTITILRFAKLIIVADLGNEPPCKWSCRTSSCALELKGSGSGIRKRLEFIRNIPDAHRRIVGRGKDLPYDKMHKSKSSALKIEFLVDCEGDFYVEAFFGGGLRSSGMRVKLQLGEYREISFAPLRAPIISGTLLGLNGHPQANKKLSVRGEGSYFDQGLFIPMKDENYGFSGSPISGKARYVITKSVTTDQFGKFRIPITISGKVTFEAYFDGYGKVVREFIADDTKSSLEGLILQLEHTNKRFGIVQIVTTEEIKDEKIRLIRIDRKGAGHAIPLVLVDSKGWLDTGWLETDAEYLGQFQNKKFKDFRFVCRVGEIVSIAKK